VNGENPVIPALQGGVKGYNIKEIPCRKAPSFRAKSFNPYATHLYRKESQYVEASL
jgi:hypothetical protein